MRGRLFLALLVGVLVAMPLAARAEPAKAATTLAARLIGTWSFKSSIYTRTDGTTFDRWGVNSKGTFMFDAGGHFVQVIMGPESRFFGAKSFFAFGTYSVDEAKKTIIIRIEGSSNSKLIGTEQERIVTALTDNKLTYVNLRASDGSRLEADWTKVVPETRTQAIPVR